MESPVFGWRTERSSWEFLLLQIGITENHLLMNALVISGGGSKGAFAGGIGEYLLNHCCRKYSIFVGTSAGSLLAPMLAAGQLERLKKVYTSIRHRDIFSTSPFIIQKKGNICITRINHFNTLKMFLKGKKTFGETKNLRKLIRKTFREDDYKYLRDSDKQVVVTVSNLSCNSVEYKSIHECEYEDFCDWMWISTNIVPFMSLVIKDGFEYADGGFGNFLPVHPAIELGASSVDAIVLRPENKMVKSLPSRNAFNVLLKSFDFMLNQIASDDILIGLLEGQNRKVEVNCYYTPRILTDNSFIFDPEEMQAWWKEGYEYAQKVLPKCFQAG